MASASEILREARLAAGISQAELARRAGFTQAHVSRAERGLVSPTVRSLEAMLRAAGANLTLVARPSTGWCDDDELRRFRALSMSERLEQAFAASAFASDLLGAANR
jgi:transcriptional regulator with XRE-family HTH domain